MSFKQTGTQWILHKTKGCLLFVILYDCLTLARIISSPIYHALRHAKDHADFIIQSTIKKRTFCFWYLHSWLSTTRKDYWGSINFLDVLGKNTYDIAGERKKVITNICNIFISYPMRVSWFKYKIKILECYWTLK